MNQLTTNDQVKNLVQIRKSLARGKAGNLAENAAFLDFLAIQAEMTAEIDKTWELIKQRMESYDIQKIDGQWGYITMAERKSFKATGRVSAGFLKSVLDTEKVKGYFGIYKKLPAGVTLSTTKYLAKKISLGA